MTASFTTIDPASAESVRDALAIYLHTRDELRGAVFVEPPTPLGKGFDSFIYTFRLGGGAIDARWSAPLVLRLQGAAAAAAKVRREADVQSFLHGLRYPTPRLLAVESAGNAFGLPFMIMERVPGATMLARVTSNPLRAGRLLTRLAHLHVDLHKLPTAGWPIDDGPNPIAVRQIERLRGIVEEHGLVALREGIVWLERHAAAVLPENAVITHNDFHPLNVLVTDKGDLSVIDWSDATLGDRHHDVARTLVLFSFAYIAASSAAERMLLKAARGFLRSRYLNAYQRAFPLDPSRLAYFEALQSWNGLLQITELGLSQGSRPQTNAAAALPSNLLAEVEAYVRRRTADAERLLSIAPV